jgi:hypothetical protein
MLPAFPVSRQRSSRSGVAEQSGGIAPAGFEARSAARTWLLAIARRVAADHIRTISSRPRTAALHDWEAVADTTRLTDSPRFDDAPTAAPTVSGLWPDLGGKVLPGQHFATKIYRDRGSERANANPVNVCGQRTRHAGRAFLLTALWRIAEEMGESWTISPPAMAASQMVDRDDFVAAPAMVRLLVSGPANAAYAPAPDQPISDALGSGRFTGAAVILVA